MGDKRGEKDTEFSQWEKEYRMSFDIHTHTVYSMGPGNRHHGKGTIEENVEAARKRGLSTVGISDHGPGHAIYGLDRKKVPEMRKEILRLRKHYPDIEILLGVEANIINASGKLDVKEGEQGQYDYILAGYHYGVFGENPARSSMLHSANLLYEKTGWSTRRIRNWNTEMTVRALYENPVRLLTHPGDKGSFDIREIAKACADRGTWMEISTWHKELSVEAIRISAESDATFVISSDAHHPCRVGDFGGGLARAYSAGLDFSRIQNIEKRQIKQ